MHAFSESAIHTVTEPRNTPNTLTILTTEDTSTYTSKSNKERMPFKAKKKDCFLCGFITPQRRPPVVGLYKDGHGRTHKVTKNSPCLYHKNSEH
jgi:hypothetical protein